LKKKWTEWICLVWECLRKTFSVQSKNLDRISRTEVKCILIYSPKWKMILNVRWSALGNISTIKWILCCKTCEGKLLENMCDM
jgi:hypothetical protein